MIKRIRQWLEPPIFEGDEEKTVQARTANTLFIYLFAALSIAIVFLIPLFAIQKTGSWIVTGTVFFGLLAGRSLIFHGKWEAGIRLVFAITYLCILALMILSGGSSSTAMFFFAIAVLVAGFFAEATLVNWFTVPTFLLAMGFSLLQDQGLIAIPEVFQFNSLFSWLATGLGLLFMIKARNLFVQNLKDALTAARVQNALFQSTEKSLDESELRYKSLFENNHAVMLIVDPDHAAIVDANPAACAYYGWTRDELLNRKISEINTLTPEKIQYELELARSEKRSHFFFKHRRADGSIRDVEIYSGPLVLSGKTLLYFIIHDVTDRKQAETAQRENQKLLTSILENLQDAYFRADISGKFTIVNPAATKMYGYGSSEEMIGMPAQVLYANEKDRESLIGELRNSGRITDWTCLAARKDGTNFWVSMNAQFIRDEEGHVTGTEGVVRDITERSRAEDDLRESQALTTAIMNSTFDLIWSVDPVNFGLLSFNNGLSAYFKNGRDIAIEPGMRPEDLFPEGDYAHKWQDFYQRALREGNYSIEYQTFTGTTTLHLTFNLLERDGKVFGISVFGKDITMSKQAEKLLKDIIVKNPMSIQVFNKDGFLLEANPAQKLLFGSVPPPDYSIFNDLQLARQGMGEIFDKLRNGKEVHFPDVKFNAHDSVPEMPDVPVWVRTIGFPLCDSNEVPERFILMHENITEHKLANEAYRASEKKYHELFQVNKDGIAIFLLNPNGPPTTFVEVNDAAHRMLGYSREEMLQLTPIMLEPHTTQDQLRGRQAELKSKGVVDFETVLLHKQGHLVYTEFTAQVIQYEGQPAVMNIVRDISERKQSEKEMRVIGTLSAALRTAPNLRDMLPVIVEQICNLLGSDTISVELIDPLTREAVVEAAYGSWAPMVGYRQTEGSGVNAWIAETKQPYLHNNIKEERRKGFPAQLFEDLQSAAGVPLIAQDQLIGYLWMGRKNEISEPESRLLIAVADIAANAIYRSTMYERSLLAAEKLNQAYDITLEGWAHALELRDQETEGHSRNVVKLTIDLAKEIGIPDIEMDQIRRGALLHDIGKMGIPDSVLLKPGTLNEREWEIMRRHPEYAYNLLSPIEYLRPVLDIPYCHHEKWDGSGYPRGLQGEQIPLAARIFAMVDVWDALMSDRPYRKGWSYEQSYKHIQEQAGKHFDPKLVDVFLNMLDKQKQEH